MARTRFLSFLLLCFLLLCFAIMFVATKGNPMQIIQRFFWKKKMKKFPDFEE
jgi:hypothetical protein